MSVQELPVSVLLYTLGIAAPSKSETADTYRMPGCCGSITTRLACNGDVNDSTCVHVSPPSDVLRTLLPSGAYTTFGSVGWIVSGEPGVTVCPKVCSLAIHVAPASLLR